MRCGRVLRQMEERAGGGTSMAAFKTFWVYGCGLRVKLPPEHLPQICSVDINHKFIDAFLIKGLEWEYIF